MPRKHFRKFLPSHDSIQSNRFIRFFGSGLQHHNLWHLNRRSVAGGVAVGLFCGLIPGPLQMISAALAAVVLRVNLPVAVVGTWYTNPFTIVPLYFLAYKLGMYVTGHSPETLPAPELDLSFGNVTQWVRMVVDWMQAMGKPFVLGLVLLATILAVLGYVGVLAAWRLYITLAWRRRARERAGKAAAP
jgi:uncharacterized protein (DUF2062 family)